MPSEATKIVRKNYSFFHSLMGWNLYPKTHCTGFQGREKMAGNQHVIDLRDWCTKFIRFIPGITVTSKNAMTVIGDNWIILYGALANLMIDNRLKVVSKFFATVNVRLGVKHWATTEYHLPVQKSNWLHQRKVWEALCLYGVSDRSCWTSHRLWQLRKSTGVHLQGSNLWSDRHDALSLTIVSSANRINEANHSQSLPRLYDRAIKADFLPSGFLHHLDVFHKQTDEKLKTGQACYMVNLFITVWPAPQFIHGQLVFVDRSLA